MAYPYKISSVFSLVDCLFFGSFCIIPPIVLAVAIVTPGNPIGGLVLLGLVSLSFWVLTGMFYFKRRKFLKLLHFVTSPGFVTVGWTEDRFVVSPEQVELQIQILLKKTKERYPLGGQALWNCVVIFREPIFLQYVPGLAARKVAGVADGKYFEVGWTEDLSEGALRHELAHRIFQVYGGDPDEATAHQMMKDMGIE